MKHIFILYTGGTIGMVQTAEGLKPEADTLKNAFPQHDSLRYTWQSASPLIDSAALTPHNWQYWYRVLTALWQDYDGFLILHGTDTLAYSAAMLALILPQDKPVILTGAQYPFGTPNGDAEGNIATALKALSQPDIRQTLIAFNHTLWPAINSSKCSTEVLAGFDNPHFGVWQAGAPRVELNLTKKLDPSKIIHTYTLTPADQSQLICHNLQHNPPDGVIVQTFGHGNALAPAPMLEAIATYTAQGRHILNISQCHQGSAEARYAQGNALTAAGAIAAGWCNLETATALSHLAAANHWTRSELIAALQQLRLIP